MSDGIKPTDIGHEIGCPGRYGVGDIECNCPGARRVVHVYPIKGDATKMLQDAIDLAARGPKGEVYLHSGDYQVTSPLGRLWAKIKAVFE